MSANEIVSKIEELNELETLIEEAKAEAENLKDAIKAEMNQREVEELEAGAFIVRWTPVTSNRFDSASFKKALPDVYQHLLKQTSSRRFSISK